MKTHGFVIASMFALAAVACTESPQRSIDAGASDAGEPPPRNAASPESTREPPPIKPPSRLMWIDRFDVSWPLPYSVSAILAGPKRAREGFQFFEFDPCAQTVEQVRAAFAAIGPARTVCVMPADTVQPIEIDRCLESICQATWPAGPSLPVVAGDTIPVVRVDARTWLWLLTLERDGDVCINVKTATASHAGRCRH